MTKTFTLYGGYREECGINQNFLPSTKVIKIENVYKIAKPLSVLSKAKNNNLYALVGKDLEVLGLGMLKELKSKEGKTIYVGQKVFTTEKKILCDYYRQKAQELKEKLNNAIQFAYKMTQTNLDNYICAYYLKEVNTYMEKIKKTEKSYKEIIKNIKCL